MLKTSPELSDFKRCADSFEHFLTHHVQIRDGGGTRLRPWDWQLRLVRVWQRHPRVVVLKARQLGVSWLAAAYALWTALFHPGALVLLISQTKVDAQELLAKVRFIFDRLPAYLQPDQVGRDNTLVLEFPELASAVEALPSTERAGRGRTARLVIADEHAFHQWSEANLAALAPTMEAGGRFLSISTADGIGNLFADLVMRARRGGEWRFVFLPYSLRPGRDAAWYARQQESYTRPWMIHQEYPRDADEAFVQTGRPVFDKLYLDKHRQLCREPLPPSRWPGSLAGQQPGELRIWAPPEPGHRYAAGADVAEGLEHGDYSDLVVLDASGERPVEVLSLHGHWPPDEFAARIDAVARVYPGVYGIERNNHGLAVLLALKRLGTPGLFRERPVLGKAGQVLEPGRPGWLTTSVTKPLMIDELEQALRLWRVELRDERAIPELVFYQTLKDGSTGAPAGQWDDRVMSRAVAVQMLKHPAQSGAGAYGGSAVRRETTA